MGHNPIKKTSQRCAFCGLPGTLRTVKPFVFGGKNYYVLCQCGASEACYTKREAVLVWNAARAPKGKATALK